MMMISQTVISLVLVSQNSNKNCSIQYVNKCMGLLRKLPRLHFCLVYMISFSGVKVAANDSLKKYASHKLLVNIFTGLTKLFQSLHFIFKAKKVSDSWKNKLPCSPTVLQSLTLAIPPLFLSANISLLLYWNTQSFHNNIKMTK